RDAARGRQFGVAFEDEAGIVMGDPDQLLVLREIGEAEDRETALPRAEHLAAAAQPQILLGDAEPVLGLAQDLETLAGDLAERLLIEEETGRRVAAAADPAAQLVQLREAEALGMLDHHDRRGGDVDADLDYRRGDEEIERPLGE